MTEQPEQWVTMSEAFAKLKSEGINVSLSKLSRLAGAHKIKSDSDPLDERARLVDLVELRTLFSSSKRLRK